MAQVLLDGRCIQNGKFDGAQRYAEEVIKKLDELVEPGKYELLIFEGNENLIQLENITKIIVKPNTFNKKCWATYKYLDHGKKLYVGFANEVVLDRNSIVTIHDIYAFYGVCNNSFYYYFKKKYIFLTICTSYFNLFCKISTLYFCRYKIFFSVFTNDLFFFNFRNPTFMTFISGKWCI